MKTETYRSFLRKQVYGRGSRISVPKTETPLDKLLKGAGNTQVIVRRKEN